MKHEWRKSEKHLDLPKMKPEFIEIPAFKFITIKGEGNPNGPEFEKCVTALYAVAYGIKMTAKKENKLPGYYDFTVYPLEGVWDLNEKGRESFNGIIDKNDLVYTLMIRQPDFVDEIFFKKVREQAKAKNQNSYLEKVCFESIKEGPCVQMLHLGSYDDEPASFKVMEDWAKEKRLNRKSKIHKEIYLSDARRVEPSKLKTVLRFEVASE
ncbi:MAG: GyrI-like domain-containing protein [Saprospiraceae bacterium]